jgi:hypothetical protein
MKKKGGLKNFLNK